MRVKTLWKLNALLLLIALTLAWYLFVHVPKANKMRWVPNDATEIWEYNSIKDTNFNLLLPLQELRKFYDDSLFNVVASKHPYSKSKSGYLYYLNPEKEKALLKGAQRKSIRYYQKQKITELLGPKGELLGVFTFMENTLVSSKHPILVENCINERNSYRLFKWSLSSSSPSIHLKKIPGEELIFTLNKGSFTTVKNTKAFLNKIPLEFDELQTRDIQKRKLDSLSVLLEMNLNDFQQKLGPHFASFKIQGATVIQTYAPNTEQLVLQIASSSRKLNRRAKEVNGLGLIHLQDFSRAIFHTDLEPTHQTYFKYIDRYLFFCENPTVLEQIKDLQTNTKKQYSKVYWPSLNAKLNYFVPQQVVLESTKDLHFKDQVWKEAKSIEIQASKVIALNDSLILFTGKNLLSVYHLKKEVIVFKKRSTLNAPEELLPSNFLGTDQAQWVTFSGNRLYFYAANTSSQLTERLLVEHPVPLLDILEIPDGILFLDENKQIFLYSKVQFTTELKAQLPLSSEPFKLGFQEKNGAKYIFAVDRKNKLWGFHLKSGAPISAFPKQTGETAVRYALFNENSLQLLDNGGGIYWFSIFPWKQENSKQLPRDKNFHSFSVTDKHIIRKNVESLQVFTLFGKPHLSVLKQFRQYLILRIPENHSFLLIFDGQNAYVYDLKGSLIGNTSFKATALPLLTISEKEESLFLFVPTPEGVKLFKIHAL